MVITLIGLSGCGKSTLASRLAAEKDWMSVCCDDLIEKQMEAEATRASVSSAPAIAGNIAGVAGWLGQPYDDGYKDRQKKYFKAENEVTKALIALAKHTAVEENLVIDTSGSVIYVDESILSELGRHSVFVYLRLPATDLPAMFAQYLKDPKPVIWQNAFQAKPGESNRAALERCYPLLVEQRLKLYERYADFTIPVSVAKREELNPDSLYKFLKLT